MTQMRRCIQLPLPRGDQQAEIIEHALDGAGIAVVPMDHSLGRIASTDEVQLGVRILRAKFTGNVGKQALFTHHHAMLVSSPAQHFNAGFKIGAVKFLVRIDPWHHADHFIDHLEGGVHQRQVGSRDRVESAGQHADPVAARGSGQNDKRCASTVAESTPSERITE